MSDCCKECGSITLFKGTNGDYVQVTPEPPGPNCAEGGLKVDVISGVDDTTIKNTQYVCNGAVGPQGVGIASIAWASNSGGQPQGTQGTTDTYTITLTDASTYNFLVTNGADGADGQDIDHTSFTSSTGGGGAGVAGETDTYTVWGDVGETINLGTFEVYNGDNGAPGAPGGTLTFESIDSSIDGSATINVAVLATGNPALFTTVPNTIYYIDLLNGATVNVEITMPDSLGTNNGGNAPALGDTVEFIASLSQNVNIRVNTVAGVIVGMLLPGGIIPGDYQQITPPNQFDWNTGSGVTQGLFIKLKYVATDKWVIIDQGWKNETLKTVAII
jgi:hypothetical protein